MLRPHSLTLAGLSTDPATAALRYHVLRSRQAFAIIAGVFGADAVRINGVRAGRLVHVLSTWTFACGTGNTGCGVAHTNSLLSYNPPNTTNNVHALGVTAYFCDGTFSNVATSTTTQLLAACRAVMSTTNTTATLFAGLARSYNLSVATYEAGPTLAESSAISSGSVSVTRRYPVVNHRRGNQR